MKMITAVFIFGVILPAVLTVILFTVFLICLFQRGRWKDKLLSKCPQFCCRRMKDASLQHGNQTSQQCNYLDLHHSGSSGSGSVSSNQYGFNHDNPGYDMDEQQLTKSKTSVLNETKQKTSFGQDDDTLQQSNNVSGTSQDLILGVKGKNRPSLSSFVSQNGNFSTLPTASPTKSAAHSSNVAYSSVFHTSSSSQFNPTMSNMSFGSIQQQSIYSFQSGQSSAQILGQRGGNQNNNCNPFPSRQQLQDGTKNAPRGGHKSLDCMSIPDRMNRHSKEKQRRKSEGQKPVKNKSTLDNGFQESKCFTKHKNLSTIKSTRSDDSGYSNSGSDCENGCRQVHALPGVHKSTVFPHSPVTNVLSGTNSDRQAEYPETAQQEITTSSHFMYSPLPQHNKSMLEHCYTASPVITGKKAFIAQV